MAERDRLSVQASRLFAGAANDVDADLLVAGQLEVREHQRLAQQSHAATGER